MELKDGTGKPVPFDIEFVKADRKKKTGGEIVALEKVVLSKNQDKESPEAKSASEPGHKSPNHWQNSTRNLKILSSNHIRKVHIRLITKFNGQKVFW